jgi:hypothetical protein
VQVCLIIFYLRPPEPALNNANHTGMIGGSYAHDAFILHRAQSGKLDAGLTLIGQRVSTAAFHN